MYSSQIMLVIRLRGLELNFIHLWADVCTGDIDIGQAIVEDE